MNPVSPLTRGDNVSLSWQAPTTTIEGTPLTGLAGFKIYYGTHSPLGSENVQVIDVGNTITYTVGGLSAGTYFFVVTSYDDVGNESTFSDEVSSSITGI